MLVNACREAESILLDRRYFSLPKADLKKFIAMLDNPPRIIRGLRRLLHTNVPWDR